MEMDTEVNRSDQLGKLLKTVYESNFEKWLSVTLYELHEHPIILPLLVHGICHEQKWSQYEPKTVKMGNFTE